MERYPNLSVLVDDYERDALDGRRNSRTLDGKPRVQIMYESLQHEFHVTHPALNVDQVQTLIDFYNDNKTREFEFEGPDDGEIYVCVFYSPPKFGNYIANRKSVSFVLAGERKV